MSTNYVIMNVVINSFETKTSDAKKESRKFQEICFSIVSYVLSSFSTEEKCGKQKQAYVVMEL